VPLGAVGRAAGARRFWRARAALADLARTALRPSGEEEQEALVSAADASGPSALGRLIRTTYLVRRLARSRPLDMDRVDFDKVEFRFGAAVTIRLHDGQELHGEVRIPQGAAGSGIDRIGQLMTAKLETEAAAAGHPERAAAIDQLLEGSPAAVTARDLARAASAG